MRSFKHFGIITAFFATVMLMSVTQADAQRGDSMYWSGTVDQDVQLVIRGNNVQTRTIRGNSYRDSRYNFDGNRGRGNNRRGNNRGGWGNNNERGRASVSKDEGRGRVRVVQQPNRRNNYTTIIRIEDPKGGSDRYRIRVNWR